MKEAIVQYNDTPSDGHLAISWQPLIRCKDCKWYDEQISLCDNCGLPREQTFFCADGERLEGR